MLPSDLRSANLLQPPVLATRPTFSQPSVSTSIDITSRSSTSEESSDEVYAGAVDPDSHQDLMPADDPSIPRTNSPMHMFPPPSGSRRNSHRNGPILCPNEYITHPSSPTKSGWGGPSANPIHPLSPTATLSSAAPAPTYLRQTMTGSSASGSTRFSTPLKPTYTGNVESTVGPSSGFGGTPSCPRCEKPVYFAEQVRSLDLLPSVEE